MHASLPVALPRQRPGGMARRARCLVVIGSLCDAVHLFPVVTTMRRAAGLEPFVVLTGQSGQEAQDVDAVLALAGIVPDVDLRTPGQGRSVNRLIADAVTGFDDVLSGMGHRTMAGHPATRRDSRAAEPAYPHVTLVHGNSTSALGAALASTGEQIPVVHVDAMSVCSAGAAASLPGDFNGRMLSRLATLTIAPTMADLGRLVSEGVPVDRVFVTGSPGVDAFQWAAARAHARSEDVLAGVAVADAPLVAVVMRHVRPDGYARLLDWVRPLAEGRSDCTVVLPADPAARTTLQAGLASCRNVRIVPSLNYAPQARLVARATLAITDSATLQQEAPAVGTPVLVTDATTRQQMSSEAGTTVFAGSDPALIAAEALRLLSDDAGRERMRRAPNPFGDGRAAERIAAAVAHLVLHGVAPTPFGREFAPPVRPSRTASVTRLPNPHPADPASHANAGLAALAQAGVGTRLPGGGSQPGSGDR